MDVAPLLRCSSCRSSPLEQRGRELACPGCGAIKVPRGGYLDLLAEGRGAPTAASAEQRLMESELIARLYERVWRPSFVRLMAGSGASASTGGFGGEFFLHKNALGMDERGGPWLDLSCGPGLFARGMGAAAPADWVVGLDISRAMLEVAARRVADYPNVFLVRGDAHDLPLSSASFSGVNNAGALHAYDDPEAVFSEVLRILRKGGVFVGSTFAPSRTLAGRLASKVGGIRRFEPGELRAWLSRIGFADYEELRLADSIVFKVRRP